MTTPIASSAAPAASPLLGTWRLLSYVREVLASGEVSDVYGKHPHGYLNYGADGRMIAIFVRDGRGAPAGLVPSDAESAALFRSVISYAGDYTVEGDQVTHSIDVSWNQAWTGTRQVRSYRIDGELLCLTTAPSRDPLDGHESVRTLTWVKVQPG